MKKVKSAGIDKNQSDSSKKEITIASAEARPSNRNIQRQRKVQKLLKSPVTEKSKTPKRITTSIKFDSIHPADYMKYEMRLSCEECTHFNFEEETCTLGYVTKWHRKAFQRESYELTGKVALCRFQEID